MLPIWNFSVQMKRAPRRNPRRPQHIRPMLLTEGCQEATILRMALQPAAHAYARAGTEAATETGMIARMVVPARTIRPVRTRRTPVRLAIATDAAIIDVAAAAPAAIGARTP